MAKEKTEEKVLEQTKGTFKLIGKVVNIDRENAYVEGTQENGPNKGKQKRNIRFGIQTSDNNIVQVSSFSFLPDEIYIWDTNKKSGAKMDYSKWKVNRKALEKQKKIPLQSRVGLERDADGKSITQHLGNWDMMEYLHENLYNGDSVVVEGDVGYNTYKNKANETVSSMNLNISSLFKLKKPVDFSAEDFEEVALFTQEFVFDSTDIDKAKKKATVYGKAIAYNKSVTDVTFDINFEDDEDGVIEKMAKTYATKVPFGSLLQVHGNIVNRAVSEAVEEEEDDEVLAMLGGNRNRMEVTTRYERFMEITGTDALEKEKYTEEELFQNDTKLVEKADKEDDDLGDLTGKKSAKKPKEEDEDEDAGLWDDGDDEDSEDLPF